MFSKDDYAWLITPAGREAWQRALEVGSPLSMRELKLLARCTDTQARLLIEQLEFASGKAKRKVSDPAKWFWTSRLLEQSSDEATAKETALDFPSNTTVVDGCCGAGADAVALSARGCHVQAVDMDPVACILTQSNLASHSLEASVECSELSTFHFPPEFYINLDPDRRINGSRTIEPQHMSPRWESIAPLVVKGRGASLKLAPGFRVTTDFPWLPASEPHVVRWLSVHGSVRQQRWYWNLDRWPANSRVASMQLKSGAWHHEVFLSLDEQKPDRTAGFQTDVLIGTFVADQDPVVRASELTLPLANRLGVDLIGSSSGYYNANAYVSHPMLQWFRVLDCTSMDEKKIRSLARKLLPNTWELKSRGVDIDLHRMQRILPTDPESPQALTILFTRQGKKHMALFTERVIQNEISTDAT